mmetsp:Transcript_23167/g.72332  ORF Transcript_23167/g.72332 Transcript_23167/m.72332 type:complete len:274 (+) Transcript_23167:5797-6618(+)
MRGVASQGAPRLPGEEARVLPGGEEKDDREEPAHRGVPHRAHDAAAAGLPCGAGCVAAGPLAADPARPVPPRGQRGGYDEAACGVADEHGGALRGERGQGGGQAPAGAHLRHRRHDAGPRGLFAPDGGGEQRRGGHHGHQAPADPAVRARVDAAAPRVPAEHRHVGGPGGNDGHAALPALLPLGGGQPQAQVRVPHKRAGGGRQYRHLLPGLLLPEPQAADHAAPPHPSGAGPSAEHPLPHEVVGDQGRGVCRGGGAGGPEAVRGLPPADQHA